MNRSNVLDPAASQDLSALAWVQDELRRSLEAAHKALRRLVKESTALDGGDVDAVDPSVLRAARHQLHQGVGALELVGLPAAASLLRASEAVLQRYAAKPHKLTPLVVDQIERASFALLDYLARLLAGRPVSPLALFPQYRAVQEAAGAERIHPADLWPVDWQVRPVPADTDALPREADARARGQLEQLLLVTMRGQGVRAAPPMSGLFAGLGLSSRDASLTLLWRLAAAVFEAVGLGLLPADVYIKRLASRLLAQLRQVEAGQLDVPESLAHDLLFFCAQAQAPGAGVAAPRLMSVREAYGLQATRAVDYERSELGRYDPAWIVQARKRVAGAKDAWSAVAAGELHRLPGLSEQFALVNDSLKRLFPHSEPLSQALSAALLRTQQSDVATPPPLAMEVATGLLFLEASLDDGELDQPDLPGRIRHLAERIQAVTAGQAQAPVAGWMEELYRRVSDRQTIGSVVQELRVSLSDAEKQIDLFFRNPADANVLLPVAGQLQVLRGVLSVLGMDHAAAALLRMRDDVEGLTTTQVEPEKVARAGVFDRLAANLGALGFLIDMVHVQPHLAKALFVFDAESGRLNPVMGRVASDDRGKASALDPRLLEQVQLLAASARRDEVPAQQVAAELERLSLESQVAEQPALAAAVAQARAALRDAQDAQDSPAATSVARDQLTAALTDFISTASDAETLGAEAVERPALVVTAPSGLVDLADDEEMRDIFLEEAQEVLQAARMARETLVAQPDDREAMTTLRRAFHTLKGSARMVGLREFGEAGWACEQLYNARLAAPHPADEGLLSFTRRALDELSDWVGDIAGRKAFARSAAGLNTQALVAREPQSLPALPADASRSAWPRFADAGLRVAGDADSELAPLAPFRISEPALPMDLRDPPASPDEAPADMDLAALAEGSGSDHDSDSDGDSDSDSDGFSSAATELMTFPPDEVPVPAAPPASPNAPALDSSLDRTALAASEPLDALPDDDDALALSLPALAVPTPTLTPSPTPLPSLDETTVFENDTFDTVELGSPVSEAVAPQAPAPQEGRAVEALAAAADEVPAWAAPVMLKDDLLDDTHDGDLRAALLAAQPTVLPPAAGSDALFTLDAAAPPQPQTPLALPQPEVLEGGSLSAFGAAFAGHPEHMDLAQPPAHPAEASEPPDPAAAGDAAADAAASAEPDDMAVAAELATAADAAEAEASQAYEDEQVKCIGPLRISIPLFNIYLNEADEQSRRLMTELAEWSMELHRPVGETAIALAHSLAGNSATVGFSDLSRLARALEHALVRADAWGRGSADEAQLFVDASDDIRRLLHQFAAGFLRQPQPELLDRLAAHEQQAALRLAVAGDSAFGRDAAADRSGFDTDTDTDTDAADEPLPPDDTVSPAVDVDDPWGAAVPRAEVNTGFGGLGLGELQALQPAAAEPVALNLGRRAADDGVFDDEHQPLDTQDEVDAELFPIFEEECAELLPQLFERLRDWAARPGDSAAPSACMRVLHTLKGGARLAGAMALGELAHRMEARVEALASSQSDPALALSHAGPSAAAVETLHQQADRLAQHFERLCLSHAAPGAVPPSAPSAALPPVPAPAPVQPAASASVPVPVLDANAVPAARAPVQAVVPEPAVPLPAAVLVVPAEASSPAINWSRFLSPHAPQAIEPAGAAPVSVQSAVRVRAPLLDRLVNQAGEVSIARARIESEVAQIRTALADLTDNLERLRGQLRDIDLQAETQMSSRMDAAKAASQTFDPLEFDRFTRFQELTRMMTESVGDVATVQRSVQRCVQRAEDELAVQSRLTRDLQDDLLRTRMVEFETLADRFYRVVRQAAKETGKQVRLDLIGGAIEVDRGVLDRMTGAFEHLLRNGVSHGIEPVAARVAAGKDPAGAISVTVSQSGNEVAVEVRDDGAGLDLAAIRRKALASGLLAADAQPSDAELAQLIFAPGFSTAERVTELSGRGVGMDVVRAEVNAMGGRIVTGTTAGAGTSFTLLLPLTTAVTQVVLLRCGDTVVAVPSTLIEGVRRVPGDALGEAYAQAAFALDGERLPFFWLGALLQTSTRSVETASRTPQVVVVRSAQQRVVVHIDEVLGNQEVVVKNLGPQLARVPGLAGITLLASGAVALIYNPVALAALYGPAAVAATQAALAAPLPDASQQAAAAAALAGPVAPLVLVVDDSLTVRRVTQRLLLREGYRVVLAKDGLDALERLAEELPQVVLSDIEMPRMDGFDLVRNIRGDARLRDLPVIMITSRIAQKHRDHAAELGVNHYLGKPYSEEDLLALIGRYAHDSRVAEALQ